MDSESVERPSPIAVAALVCAIVGPVFGLLAWMLSLGTTAFYGAVPLLVGVVLGHVAVVRIKKSEGALGGSYFAIAAIVLGYAVLIVGGVVGVAVYFIMRSIGD